MAGDLMDAPRERGRALPLPVLPVAGSTPVGLHRRFAGPETYAPAGPTSYRLLPFRFTPLDDKRVVATNFAGDYIVLPRSTLHGLIRHELTRDHVQYADLKSRHFLLDDASDVALDLLAAQYRTSKEPLANFTALHLFVVTLRCDHSCGYCQVSRVSENRSAFDMTPETADRAVDLMFQSPSPGLKVEFQGGESLLNFDLIRRIVERVEARNAAERRAIQFVIATNLSPLTDEMLDYMKEHGIYVSTSLDGPRALHNANRPRPGGDSYDRAISGIARVREALGHDGVAALMTTTRFSLDQPEAIVDEYVRLGFTRVFLRWMSPYGFAAKTGQRIGYDWADWQAFYRRGLDHILRLNAAGVSIREEYASIILGKLLTPYGTTYVDLQSPTGLGISTVVYNYDADVYMSDEGRMLAETGDRSFRLGNVHADSYEDLFYSDRLQQLVLETMSEGIPMCADCAFQPICGTDPTFHRATQGDVVGHRPTSDYCRRNMFVMKLLVSLLEDDAKAAATLRRWAR
jgi:His-Xaa-Ser system radical SAM maturase HxsB